MTMNRRALLACAFLALAGCAGPFGARPDARLAGRVWASAARRYATPQDVERRVVASDVTLLGETHDNPLHHGIQVRLLRAALAGARRPALAMEQIDTEWQDAVDAAIAGGTSADALAQAAHASSGWNWKLYAPIVQVALDERLPIVAMNISRNRTRAIVKEGFASLGPGEAERLALARTWNPQRNADLRREIVEGHCGDDSPLVDKLVDVQRARDATMADRILAHADRGVVAILGRAHARRDLAVPLYLAARAPERRVLSIGIVEVRPDAHEPQDYPETMPGRFDFVWFTLPAARPDPCAGFKPLK